MSYTLNFAEQAMERVNASASYRGVSVMDFLMQAIERAVADVEARRREKVERTSPREGEPYKFNRADAYPEGVFA